MLNEPKRCAFSQFHPIILLLYYIFLMSVAVFTVNPIFTLLLLIGGILFDFAVLEKRVCIRYLVNNLFLIIIISALNPLFSHHGETPLFFLNGKPVTLEAFLYGINMALTVSAVLMWCVGFSHSFSSDKAIYLFGKPFPRLALVVSVSMRFIPLFVREYKRIYSAQKSMGLFSQSTVPDRIFSAVKTFSALITWSMENSIDTANSMKSRGYGLKGRTSFSVFKFTKKDGVFLVTAAVLFSAVLFSLATKESYFCFYPRVSELAVSSVSITSYIAYGVIAFLPFLTELKEVLVWKLLRSRI